MEDLAAETIDESQQTAQDYGLVVDNPPPDVKDPDVYKAFFSKWVHMTASEWSAHVKLSHGQLLLGLGSTEDRELC